MVHVRPPVDFGLRAFYAKGRRAYHADSDSTGGTVATRAPARNAARGQRGWGKAPRRGRYVSSCAIGSGCAR